MGRPLGAPGKTGHLPAGFCRRSMDHLLVSVDGTAEPWVGGTLAAWDARERHPGPADLAAQRSADLRVHLYTLPEPWSWTLPENGVWGRFLSAGVAVVSVRDCVYFRQARDLHRAVYGRGSMRDAGSNCGTPSSRGVLDRGQGLRAGPSPARTAPPRPAGGPRSRGAEPSGRTHPHRRVFARSSGPSSAE